jgi:hypothetical protein
MSKSLFINEGAVTCAAVEIWECSPMLRWVTRYKQIEQYRPEWGDTCSVGQESYRVLQQLWWTRNTGKREWRDVPTEEQE